MSNPVRQTQHPGDRAHLRLLATFIFGSRWLQVPLYLADLNDHASLGAIHEALVAHYAGQDIVEVVDLKESANLSRVNAVELADTDRMKLYVFGTAGAAHVNLVALLDNLGKGASGAAVQNMDLMLKG